MTIRLGLGLTLAALALGAGPPAAGQTAQGARGRLAPIGPAGTARGWVHDRRQPGRSQRVYFSIDRAAGSLPSTSILAAEPRRDVNREEGSTGDHGFRFTIPDAYRDGRPHTLYAYARDLRTGRPVELLGSPQAFQLFRRDAPKVPQRWYEDNNLGESGGIVEDFAARYAPDRMASWRRARETMDVYMIGSQTYTRHVAGKPELMRRFAAAHAGMQICVDDTSATWAHLRNPQPTFAGGLFAIESMKRLGLDVRYVALQSVLDKPPGGGVIYRMADRVRDVVAYVRTVQARWPEIQVGLIDSMPAHRWEWRTAYLMLRNGLRDAGLELDFLLLDMPMPWAMAPGGFDELFAVKDYVKRWMGWGFGWVVSQGKEGAPSLAAYRSRLLDGLREFQRRGGGADFTCVMSWSPLPTHSAPDALSVRNATGLSLFREVDHRLPR